MGTFALSAVVIIGAIDFTIAEYRDWLARPRSIVDSSRLFLGADYVISYRQTVRPLQV